MNTGHIPKVVEMRSLVEVSCDGVYSENRGYSFERQNLNSKIILVLGSARIEKKMVQFCHLFIVEENIIPIWAMSTSLHREGVPSNEGF